MVLMIQLVNKTKVPGILKRYGPLLLEGSSERIDPSVQGVLGGYFGRMSLGEVGFARKLGEVSSLSIKPVETKSSEEHALSERKGEGSS
jgi:hypothetical protein